MFQRFNDVTKSENSIQRNQFGQNFQFYRRQRPFLISLGGPGSIYAERLPMNFTVQSCGDCPRGLPRMYDTLLHIQLY